MLARARRSPMRRERPATRWDHLVPRPARLWRLRALPCRRLGGTGLGARRACRCPVRRSATVPAAPISGDLGSRWGLGQDAAQPSPVGTGCPLSAVAGEPPSFGGPEPLLAIGTAPGVGRAGPGLAALHRGWPRCTGGWPRGSGGWPRRTGGWPRGSGGWPRGTGGWPRGRALHATHRQAPSTPSRPRVACSVIVVAHAPLSAQPAAGLTGGRRARGSGPTSASKARTSGSACCVHRARSRWVGSPSICVVSRKV